MNYAQCKPLLASVLLASTALFTTTANAGPKWETVDGKTRMVVNLRYVCSSWLYLRFLNTDQASSTTTIRDTNATKCAEFAATATLDTQVAFDRSNLPIRFTKTSEVEPGGYSNLIGTQDHTAASAEAPRVARANQGKMPGLTIQRITGWRERAPGSSCQYNCTTYWASTTAYVAPNHYLLSDPDMLDLLAWPDSNPQYLPAVGDFSVTILVKPFAAPGQEIIGRVKDTIDWKTKVSGNRMGAIADLTPDNYFRYAGVIATIFDYQRNTIAHELGHVFGALHERDNWGLYPQIAKFLDSSGAQIRPGGAYTHFDITNAQRRDGLHDLTCINTIMTSTAGLCSVGAEWRRKYANLTVVGTRTTSSFSSPDVIVPEYRRAIGSAWADNRFVVAETFKYLNGGNCFPGATLPPLKCQ